MSYALRFYGKTFHICGGLNSNALRPVLLRQVNLICGRYLLAERKVFVGSYLILSDARYGSARSCNGLGDIA